MTSEEFENINFIKDRYHWLNLTFEQAEQLYPFERDRYKHSDKRYFSDWETYDYELSTFRQILTADQLKIYEEELAEKIKVHEQNLIDEDSKRDNEIAYTHEILAYYENEFLPELYQDTYTFTYQKIGPAPTKIQYLKSEYKQYLHDSKAEILINHFRNYRLFKPKALEAALLRHKIFYLWPYYRHFKFSADDATKSVINHVKSSISRFPDQTEELLQKKMTALIAFKEKLHEKYYGERQGWHLSVGQSTEEEQNEERILTLLLLDRDKYGL